MYVDEKKSGEAVAVDEIGQVLLKTLDYIDKYGWCQHSFHNCNGNACIIGAMDRIGIYNPLIFMAQVRLKSYLGIGNSAVPPQGTIITFNDAAGRTVEEVRETLLGAAYFKPNI